MFGEACVCMHVRMHVRTESSGNIDVRIIHRTPHHITTSYPGWISHVIMIITGWIASYFAHAYYIITCAPPPMI